ncbi:DUF1501 domain-containing protein [Rhodopirellula sallentina]|uniref:Protein containing DUF1501 n=1 Tax=Rhodopirellula sallentina SM41 TaxID=1263870 RepID=M5U553_9BACT|nr:DUF1501 domain-containing protein [Rhodopirellula sallentina]EMI56575.1 protein containing DUF1501 [Rhodopirellula sallentina SM41]
MKSSRLSPEAELNLVSARLQTRRHFLANCSVGLGAISAGLLGAKCNEGSASTTRDSTGFASDYAKPAKHVIYLHMAGSPPQHELFDFKPELKKHHLEPCPDELIEGKMFAFIKGKPKLLGPVYPFKEYGESGMLLGEKIPHIGQHADDLCLIRSMHTDQFNHAPAQLLLHTGSAQFGGSSFGSWATYGLGSESDNLPGFIVMVSGGNMPSGGKSLWGNGVLPSVFQGVQCRSEGDPILYVSNPDGMGSDIRRASLDALNELNRREHEVFQDPETLTRIEQYELAFRMQTAVPEVMDIKRESKQTLELYGAEPGKASFANNCLLARRLVEQGVRFVQLFDWGWDIHGTAKYDDMETQFPMKCTQADKPIAALLTDLKQRGLLDDTLVVFGGEFGRTPMVEARNGTMKFIGRDHHPDCFSVWVAGGGFKRGMEYGATDELGFKVAENPVDVKDFQATVLHAMGLDPYRLSFLSQGLNQRLIGPSNEARIIHDLLI